MEQLKIESMTGSHDGICIHRLSGPFTLPDVMDFQAIFRSRTDPVTLIDLTDVPYLDSAALGAIISVHTSSQRNQRKYALTGVSERLRTLMNVAGVEGLLITYPSVEEAQQKLTAKVASN